MCKKFPIFCPKKSLVSMLTWRCPGTWVVARWSHLNRTCQKDIQGFLKMCGKEVRKRKGEKVHRNYSDYLIWVIILWRGRGPNGDNNAWTAFSWVALTRVNRVFRFTKALFTLDELLYQLAPSGWLIKEPTGLFAPHHGKWSWLPIKERVEKEFKELAS
jgi:hypothetical protein